MDYWPLQDAKARLSELTKKVLKSGPRGISIRGKHEIVMMSRKDYERLRGLKPSFLEFMEKSPLKNVSLDLKRDTSLTRDIDL